MEKELIRVVQLAQSGDEEAFQQLYQYFYKQAYGTAFLYCKNDADAKDVIQNAFVSIHHALPNLRSPEIFDYWMTRIIKSKCVTMFRRKREIYMDDEGLKAIPDTFELRKDFNPYENTIENEEKQLMHHFVNQLSDKQKICVEMFYFDQMSLVEVAKALDISVGTVKSRLFDARKLLKHFITKYEKEQGVTVRFRADTLLPLTFFAIFRNCFITKNISTIKQNFQQQSMATNIMMSIHIVATVVLVGTIGVGGVMLAQENQQLASTPNTETNIPTALQQKSYKKAFPSINYKGKEYNTSKAMYYAILAWYQKSGSATKEETQIIKEMYQTIQNEQGQYWDLLETVEWSKQLELI